MESKPKVKSQPTSDNVAENAKREELAKEALATRSNKTLPKGFNEESASGGPHAHDEKPDEEQVTKSEERAAEAKAKAEAEQLQRELEEAKAEKARLEKEEESSKNDNTDLASELKAELDNLRKELENVDAYEHSNSLNQCEVYRGLNLSSPKLEQHQYEKRYPFYYKKTQFLK